MAKTKPPTTPIEARPKLQDEYVTSWDASILVRTITPSDAAYYGDLDDELIRMMSCDAVIASDYELVNENVLADGGQIIPAVTDEEGEGYDLAQRIAGFCAEAVESMETDPVELFEQMLEARKYGNRIAEITFKNVLNGAESKLTLRSIKVKSRNAVQFVLDSFNNLLGFTTGYSIDSRLKPDEQVLPRCKFFLFTYRKTNEDPRGQQGFKALLCAWRQKIEAWPILQRYMKLFAVPGIIATPSPKSQNETKKNPDGTEVVDSSGNPIVLTPAQALLDSLRHWENSTVVVMANGSEHELVQATGEGQLFVNHMRLVNQELTRAQLHVTRATSEAQHGSKADSETAVDMLSTLVLYLKRRLAAAFRRDVLYVLTWLNFGEEAARLYTPHFQFGDDDRYNWAEDAEAITGLAAILTDSQVDALTGAAGIPAPLPNEERPQRGRPPITNEDPNDPNAPKDKDKPAPGKKTEPKRKGALVVRDVILRRAHSINLRLAA